MLKFARLNKKKNAQNHLKFALPHDGEKVTFRNSAFCLRFWTNQPTVHIGEVSRDRVYG